MMFIDHIDDKSTSYETFQHHIIKLTKPYHIRLHAHNIMTEPHHVLGFRRFYNRRQNIKYTGLFWIMGINLKLFPLRLYIEKKNNENQNFLMISVYINLTIQHFMVLCATKYIAPSDLVNNVHTLQQF